MKLYLIELSDDVISSLITECHSENLHVHFRKYKSHGYIYFPSKNLNKVEAILRNISTSESLLPVLTNCYITSRENFNYTCGIDLKGNTLTDLGFFINHLENINGEETATYPTKYSITNPSNGITLTGNTFSMIGIRSGGGVITVQGYSEVNTDYSFSEMVTLTYMCLSENTMVSLYNGTEKNIKDITYDDYLLVWDFDKGEYSKSKPLWIKKEEIADCYNRLEFSNGCVLETISQHRILNIEKGKFTYPMTDETPLDTTTFSLKGGLTKLVKKEIIYEKIYHYNIITDYHINLFANGILTSCRYNNIYHKIFR